MQSRLRLQIQADALRPLRSTLDEDALEESLPAKAIFTPETIEEVAHFLRLNVRSAYCDHSNVLKNFNRPRTDYGWYLLIFATSMRIVSGAGHSTKTRTRWMNNALARKKMHMTDIAAYRHPACWQNSTELPEVVERR